ncbi:hypothetical protein LCGC14_1279480 [marine sediment metagenome]|uniref:ATP-binding protein n=2 Tax=root TaxID=1 RepID=A0A831R0P1_9GAMM|nr:ATP-binding protein [Marinobacter antarcticus]HDZ25046.1 ATP-binding protein [Candidatus Aminicenantes bacterium]HEA52023.1 ATP-binding protein [Marinobacter antarcticus]
MDIETSSAIKLFFPNPSLQLVYFEAIHNSLDANATEIDIDIDISSFEKVDTLKLAIADNGDGFNDENFDRFKTLLRPRDYLHKGIGRLIFLNYFKKISVLSEWDNARRSFVFKENFSGEANFEELKSATDRKTILVFTEFSNERVKSYDNLKPDSLKEQVIDQFLPKFQDLRSQGVPFKIKITLNTDEENVKKGFLSSQSIITENDLPRFSTIIIEDEAFDAFSTIKMHYHIERSQGKGRHFTAFDIDGRTVEIKLLSPGAVPAGYDCIFIFESELFHTNSDSSRQKLVLPDGVHEVSLNRLLTREVGKILAEKIPQINENNRKVKDGFEKKFPHLLGYFEEETAGLIDRDDALQIAQQKFFRIQKEILQCEELTDREYEKSLELSSRTLTEYILYREKIIRRMRKMTKDNSESEIHNLIVPRYRKFSQESMVENVYQNNAWLLDDKFMNFRTVLSEGRMDEVIKHIRLDEEVSGEDGRPDIAMIFSADPNAERPVDVVMIEIKRKTDDEKENQYSVNQLMDRAAKLVEFCPNIQRMWYYAVIQISDQMSSRLRQLNWTPLYSTGKTFYQEFKAFKKDGTVVPAPTFVMSFDAIVSDAETRNHIFLEILREGMKKLSQS